MNLTMTQSERENTMKNSEIEKEFREWIENQPVSEFEKTFIDREGYAIDSPYGRCEIRFYDDDIVEMMIYNKADMAVKYYLHFQLQTMEYAIALYNEMMEAFSDLKDHEKVRVLLCCTSGATTGYFAELLNETAKAMGLDYSFDASSYCFLYEKAPLYDVILTAPQINYNFKKIVNCLPRKLILQMPTAVFAQNNAFKMLSILNEQMKDYREKKMEEERRRSESDCFSSSLQNLVISVGSICGTENFRTYGRVYEGDQQILEDSQVKPRKFGVNFIDLLDSLFSQIQALWNGQDAKPTVSMISLALPGEFKNGMWTLFQSEYKQENLQKLLEERYHVPAVLNNNANVSALGFALENPEYQSVIFLSHPYGEISGGQGIVIDQKILQGSNGRAGEMHYFVHQMQYSNTREALSKTEPGCYELVTRELLPSLCLIDPDVIAVRSPMTSDMGELAERLASFIPERDLPKLVYISDMENYMLDGCREMARRRLNEMNALSV